MTKTTLTALFVIALAQLTPLFAADNTGPSEADVKAAFLKAYANREADEVTVTFDGAIKTAPPIVGQKVPLAGKQLFPVKADFTVAWIYKGKVWPRTTSTHWKDGVYDFYRDSFGGWEFAIETQPTHTLETVNNK